MSVIEADLSALKKKIDELTDTKIEVNMLKESITDEPDLCLELEKLHYLINEKRAELDCDYDNDDYDDLKSQNIVDSYRLYKAQQALLENIDKERFNSFFAKDNIDISPEFIIDDSKQATKERLSSARADGAVIRQIKKDELDELLRKEDMILKKLRRIEESKDKIFASKHSLSTLDILKRRFSETEKQKAELDFKYRYADIDDRIKRIKQKIDDLYQQYAESYETNNQDSYDRVGTSSSSSS